MEEFIGSLNDRKIIMFNIMRGNFICENKSIKVLLTTDEKINNIEKKYIELSKAQFIYYLTELEDFVKSRLNDSNRALYDFHFLNSIKEISIPKIIECGFCTKKEMSKLDKMVPTFEQIYKENTNKKMKIEILLSAVEYVKNNLGERLEKLYMETKDDEIWCMMFRVPDGPDRIINMVRKGIFDNETINNIIYINEKDKNEKLKDELIWYSATRGILPEEERDEVIRVLKDRKKVPISELTKLYVFGFLTPYELIHQMEMTGKTQKQIKEFLKKNPEIQVELSDLELLICLKSKLIENDYLLQRFKSPEDIMRLLSLNFQYTSETKEETSFAGLKNEEIIEILKKLPKQLMPSSDLLYKFYMNLEDIQNENGTQLYFTGKEMLQFAEAGLLEDTRLIDIYEKEKSQIPLKSYIDYFSIEKILTILENPEYCEKLVTMLKDIKSKQITEYGVEKTESEIEKWIMQYVSQHRRKGDDKSEISKTLTTLCEKGILDIKEIIKYNIENGDLLDLYSKGKAKLSEICSNLTSDDLTNLYYDDQATLQEITELFSNGLIKREIYYGILSDNDISDAIITGDIKAVNILEAYMNNNLKLKDVKTIFNKENDILNEYLTDAIVDISIPEDKEQKSQYIGKIEELYLNGVIGYDMLARMRDDEKIEEKVFKEILSKYEIAKAIEEIRKRYGDVIENVEDVYPPNPDPNPGPNPEPRPDPKPNRTPIYMQYIMELSQNSARPIRIVKGNLNGYKFILLENMQVVILEKERDNNATYVLPVVKALEMAQDNTRTELRGTTDVKAVNHTANWAGNLNTAIQEVQERTILEGQPNVTYIKELTGERKNRIAELGKAIREYYIDQKNRGE